MSRADRTQAVTAKCVLRRTALSGVVAGVLLAFVSPLSAGTEAGIEAFKAGAYEKALEHLRPAAEEGDASAQYYYGSMLYRGLAVDKDIVRARSWFRRGAERGNADAQASLAYMYSNGLGGAEDDSKAAKWYRKAADQGNRSAQRNLGLMYEEGEGVEQSDEKAVNWFRRAAEQGDAVAQRRLGDAYWRGEGVPEDVERAEYWMRQGVDLSKPTHKSELAFILRDTRLAKYKEAYKLFRGAALAGIREAQLYMAILINRGDGVEEDVQLANAWFKMLADSSDDHIAKSAKHILAQVVPHKSEEEVQEINRLARRIAEDPEAYAPEGNLSTGESTERLDDREEPGS